MSASSLQTRQRTVALPVTASRVAAGARSEPQEAHTCAAWPSEQCMNRSWRRNEVPCASIESRSISPKRIPPARLRPLTGWRVMSATGPRARTWYLSATMWRSRW
eukprot:Amastigsp_a841949_32.p4 type:complete len:105 gc:universal Amastigsp_a841949_32:1821-1507(-)